MTRISPKFRVILSDDTSLVSTDYCDYLIMLARLAMRAEGFTTVEIERRLNPPRLP